MKRTETYCIFDTETPGVVEPSIYDLGYTIYNGTEIILTRSYLIKEVWENKEKMNSAYYKEKISKYEKLLKEGKTEIKPFMWVLREW